MATAAQPKSHNPNQEESEDDPKYTPHHLDGCYPKDPGQDTTLEYLGNFRTHMLFVKRVFCQLKSAGIKTWYLFVANVPAQTSIKVWNQNDQNYYDQIVIDFYNTHKTESPYQPFQVIIPSLCHLGFWDRDFKNRNDTDGGFFMQKVARKQLGCHLFVLRRGYICAVPTMVLGTNETYRLRKVVFISSIYPVLRYQWCPRDQPKDQQTVLGLHYKRSTKYKTGDRYYHRFSDKCLRAGGVYEITKEKIDSMRTYLTTRPKQPYFGLFVCAGAKLVVIDGCQDTPDDEHNHNRSFIQQGGLVLVDGEIRFAEPKFDRIQTNKSYPSNDWTAYINLNLFKRLDRNLLVEEKNKLLGMKYPILFLGAQDSQFNSIAWHLCVETGNPYNRKGILDLPDGGRIVAIADGEDGLEEVIDRIYYECLHNSVVTNSEIQFRAFEGKESKDKEIERIKNILNPLDSRSYEYRYHRITPNYRRSQTRNPNFRPLYREFNIMKRGALDSATLDLYLKKQTPLPVPPMYPPLFNSANLGADRLTYLPNNQIKEMYEIRIRDHNPNLPPNSYHLMANGLYPFCFEWINYTKDDPYFLPYKYGNAPYELEKGGKMKAYDWQRSEDVTKNEQNWSNIDGVNTRLGIDGWVWEKKDQMGQMGHFTNVLFYMPKGAQKIAATEYMDPNYSSN